MYDMAIALKTEEGTHLYIQIYEHIKKEIIGGKLRTGERLPSARLLANNLSVSRSTVDTAYEQLVAEGYLESRPGSGFYVCKLESADFGKGREAQIISLNESEEPKEQGILYDFSPNGLDMSAFPYGIWRKINKNVFSEANEDLFRLGNPQGDEELRRTICRYLYHSRGVNCVPEQIVVGAGTDYLLLILGKLFDGDAGIAMENPTYLRAWQIFRSEGFRMEAVAMDEKGMLPQALENSGANVAYIMPSHQFPTGRTMPVGRRNELLKWAAAGEDRYLIEDDYDSEFRYKGKPIPSLQGADGGDHVIYIGTFSKSVAPAIRVGYMVLPRKLLGCYKERCGFMASTVSRIDQRVLNEFVRDGYFERYLNKNRKLYREKKDLLLRALKPLTGEFHIYGEDGGLHIVLTGKKKRTERDLVRLAMEAGVKVYAMSDYNTGREEANVEKASILIGYGGMSTREIEEGAALLCKVWGK